MAGIFNASDLEWPSDNDDYEPPRPPDEECEDSPKEGGHHQEGFFGRCENCGKELE